MRRYIFGGGTAVVTGAASGIGEALGLALNQVSQVRACRGWGAGCNSSRRGIGVG